MKIIIKILLSAICIISIVYFLTYKLKHPLVESVAVDIINQQIEKHNAKRIPNMGISIIKERVSRIKYDKKNGQVICFDQDGKSFLVLKIEADGKFKGTLEVPFHQAAGSGVDGSWSWGHVFVDFFLEKENLLQ